MAGFLKKIKDKIRDITLAPGARDPYIDDYYDDEDGYEYDDYDTGDYYDEADPVQVHYTSDMRDRGGRERDRDRGDYRDRDRGDYRDRDFRDRGASASSRSSSASRSSARQPEAAKPSNVYSLSSHVAGTSAASARPTETVVVRPKVIDDAVEIGNHVRGGRMCIVDLTNLPAAEAQRIADYLGGVCLAVDGQTTRVNNGIFAVSPQNHRVMSDYREESAAFSSGAMFKKASSDR